MEIWKSMLIQNEMNFIDMLTPSSKTFKSRLGLEAPVDLYTNGFELLKTDDINKFSFWLVNNLDNINIIMELKAGKIFTKFQKLIGRPTKNSTATFNTTFNTTFKNNKNNKNNKSNTNNQSNTNNKSNKNNKNSKNKSDKRNKNSMNGGVDIPIARSIELLQLQWKQIRNNLKKEYVNQQHSYTQMQTTSSSGSSSSTPSRSKSQQKRNRNSILFSKTKQLQFTAKKNIHMIHLDFQRSLMELCEQGR